ncbi:MAG TPA: aminotransferase class V-fold PLP-dependent enzyme [Terriglobales bacterium]
MNPLALSDAEYRRVYERIAELALDYLAGLEQRSCFPGISGVEATTLFGEPLPEQGMGPAAIDDLTKVIEASRAQGPRFFGYVLGSGEPVAAGADLLASVLNQNVTAWRSGPAAVSLEHLVVGWLAQAIGCEGFRGSLTGGGSSANLMGLAMARESRLPANEQGVREVGTVYASEQAHMSIAKAVALLGIGRNHLRLIPCDDAFRMRIDLLRQAIDHDLQEGKRPIAIVGSAGTVATGSIDPLVELAEIAKQSGAWFHVDGAYGALAAIARPTLFEGMGLADSVALDPHKWLYQPLDCGCLLFRDSQQARRTFSFTGDYAKSLQEDPLEDFAFFDESLELSRRFRALKLWLSLRYHGFGSFRQQIENDLNCARWLTSLVDAAPEMELLAPVPLSAVCFRYVPSAGSLDDGQLDDLNLRILRDVQRRGRVYVSNATIHGKFALRACIVNHRTTSADVEAVIDEVSLVGRALTPGAKS